MKKTELKIVGKIGMEIAKLAVFWQAVVPWASDILDNWNWNENLVSIVMVAAVSLVGHFCIVALTNYIKELKTVKEERKNSKKRGNAAKAAPLSFCDVAGYFEDVV